MLKTLGAQIKEFKKDSFLTPVFMILEVLMETIIPLMMASIIDNGVEAGDIHHIYVMGGCMVIVACVSLFAGTMGGKYGARASAGFARNLRKAMYENIQTFSFSNIDKFSTAGLVTRLTTDVTNLQNAYQMLLRMCVRAPISLVCAMIMAFFINAKLACVYLIAVIVLGVILAFITIRAHHYFMEVFPKYDDLNASVQENVSAIRVVKAYVRGDYEIAKFEEANLNLKKESEKAFGIAVLNMPAMQFVMYATILSLLLFGGYLIHEGRLGIGELTGFLSYVLLILNSLMMMSNVFLMMTRSLASGARILEVIDEKIDLTDENAKDISVERGEIEFDHVWFKYKEEAKEYVLSDVSFHIKAGQTVGIIGQTGAAKTTLVQLIPRLYDTVRGTVKVDGVDVKNYPMQHLRDAIAMVLQKNTLFSGTMLDNLKWGDENASMAEIEEACKIACVDEFIDRLQDGYQTEMGQGGVNVSGGQKQRLCIARAILKKPKVLILDDSTSAVDTATESRIREGLAEKLPDMTKIIIAQRISSVRHADQIIILDGGRVSGIGTHESLLASNRIYQEIYESQKEGADL